jgi:hypothetical protein
MQQMPDEETPEAWAVLVARLLMYEVQWEHGEDGEYPYQAWVDGQHWVIRINDFPAEPLYTLFVDGVEATDLEDWLPLWKRPTP